MMAPEGYVPISEISYEASCIPRVTRLAFNHAISKARIFVADGQGVLTFDKRLLVQLGEEYLFINDRDWTVSVVHPFRTGSRTVLPKFDRRPEDFLQDTPPHIIAETQIAGQILSLMDEVDDDDRFCAEVKAIPAGTVQEFAKYNDKALFVREECKGRILDTLSSFAKRGHTSICAALKECKEFFILCGGLEHEPETNREQILLRELEHAMSLISGHSEEQNIQRIHKALTNGEIVAETLGGQIVPPGSWPRTTNSQGSHWFESVPRGGAVKGFGGTLLYIPRLQAEPWLSEVFPCARAKTVLVSDSDDRHEGHSAKINRPPRLNTDRETKEAWLEFVDEYEYPNKPNQDQRRRWGKERGLTRDRVDQIHSDFSPDYWKKPGRSPNSKKSDT